MNTMYTINTIAQLSPESVGQMNMTPEHLKILSETGAIGGLVLIVFVLLMVVIPTACWLVYRNSSQTARTFSQSLELHEKTIRRYGKLIRRQNQTNREILTALQNINQRIDRIEQFQREQNEKDVTKRNF